MAARPERSEGRSRWPGFAALGGGAVALGAAGVLFYLDGRETSCEDGPGEQACRRQFQTTPAAVGIAALGVGLGAWGVYRLVAGSDGEVAVGIGPGTVALGGKF